MLDKNSQEAFLNLMIGTAARDNNLWLRAIKEVAEEAEALFETTPINVEEEAYIRVAGFYTLGLEHRDRVLEQRREHLEEALKGDNLPGDVDHDKA